MIKHTPGPWVVKGTVIGPVCSIKVIGTKGGDLSDQETICFLPQANEEQVANTRLVQFAPDLLRALERISELSYDSEANRVAREAIAKTIVEVV